MRDPSIEAGYGLAPSGGATTTTGAPAPPARPTWTAGTAYALGAVVEPTAENGFRYECTTAGTSGVSEPNWPTTPGTTVTDGTVVWTCRAKTSITWTAFAIYKSGGAQPTWPTTAGDTVTDNGITWTCKAQSITDAYCPQKKQAIILESKVYSPSGDVTRYCATNDPTDWTSREDAGFLSTGLQATGEKDVSALGQYRGNLVAMTPSTSIIYDVDPDPSLINKLDSFEGIGTVYFRAMGSVNGDLYFLTDMGVRSVSVAIGGQNLEAGDVGGPVDVLVRAALATFTGDAFATYYPGLGQYWLFFGAQAFVFTRSDRAGVQCWSRYTFPYPIEEAALLSGKLYLRSGDSVFVVDETYHSDDNLTGAEKTIYDCVVWWNWLAMGRAGDDKMLVGIDYDGDRPVVVDVGYRQDDLAAFCEAVTINGDTVPGDIVPIPLMAPSFSVRLTHSADEAWEMSSMIVWVQD